MYGSDAWIPRTILDFLDTPRCCVADAGKAGKASKQPTQQDDAAASSALSVDSLAERLLVLHPDLEGAGGWAASWQCSAGVGMEMPEMLGG